MKNVILYYIISTLVYFMVGTGFIYWAVFNMASIMFSIAYMCYWFSNGNKVDAELRGWLEFMAVLSIMRGLYSLVCSYAPVDWIYSMNKIFGSIFVLCLIIKIIINRKRKQKQNGMRYH